MLNAKENNNYSPNHKKSFIKFYEFDIDIDVLQIEIQTVAKV